MRIRVVGAGLIGLATTWSLTRRGHQVELVEGENIGHGASSVAAGMLAPLSEAELFDEDLFALGVRGVEAWPGFLDGLGEGMQALCGYDDGGTLLVATNRDQLAWLSHFEAALKRFGRAAERLSSKVVRELEPQLAPRVTGGLSVPGDTQVDPRATMAQLAIRSRQEGASLRLGSRVVELDATSAVVEGREGRLDLDAVDATIVCTGAWPELVSKFKVAGLRPVKGQVIHLHGDRLLDRVVRTDEVYLVPRGKDRLLIGATMSEEGWDLRPRAGDTLDLLRHAWAVLPGIDELEVAELKVGLRPAFPDGRPLIDELEPGLFVALGHFRSGILFAPPTAEGLAEWIDTGNRPEWLAAFGSG